MDFQVAAPAGLPINDPATMVARGADPLVAIPAGGHFFRRTEPWLSELSELSDTVGLLSDYCRTTVGMAVGHCRTLSEW